MSIALNLYLRQGSNSGQIDFNIFSSKLKISFEIKIIECNWKGYIKEVILDIILLENFESSSI